MKEEPIPLDTDWVSRRLRVGCEDVKNILEEFFVESEDGWKNGRCDKDIAKYHAMADRNKANGSRGGRPKKTQKKPTGIPVATQSKPTGKPTINHEPLTMNQVKTPKIVSFKKMTKEQFRESVWDAKKDYQESMLLKFFTYWTEPDDKGKMKFQLNKTWSVSGRLSTWSGNNFGNQSSGPVQNTTRLPTTAELSAQEGVASNEDELQF